MEFSSRGFQNFPVAYLMGKRKRKALKNIREAIEGYMETLKEEGWPLPRMIGEETIIVDVEA